MSTENKNLIIDTRESLSDPLQTAGNPIQPSVDKLQPVTDTLQPSLDTNKRPADAQAVPDNVKRLASENTVTATQGPAKSTDELIDELAKRLEAQNIPEDQRAVLEYDLRNAYDQKYQSIQQQLKSDTVTQQLRQNPNTASIAAALDLQIQYVLDAMRSPDAAYTNDVKSVYVQRYQQLQDAKQRLYDLNNKVSLVSGQADMENFYKTQMMETLQSIDGSNSALVQGQRLYGDAVKDEQSLVGSALGRFHFIQSIFSPNRSTMNGPENQMAYTIRNKDQRRGRRPSEKPYDVAKLPLLMDTVTMAKDVFNTVRGDGRELFGKPYNEWTPEMKETYANYVENTYSNEIQDKSKTLLSKDPSELTPDELAEFSKYRDAYVIERGHKHYLVTRDDPQWTDEDARLFARQIANPGGNEYYDPEPWEVALSWTTAALGLALGVAALPLGASAAGLAVGAASAGVSLASMGMPPVGGPEWLHKLFTALSITTAGASLIQGGYAAVSAYKAAQAAKQASLLGGSAAAPLRALSTVDEMTDLASLGTSVGLRQTQTPFRGGLVSSTSSLSAMKPVSTSTSSLSAIKPVSTSVGRGSVMFRPAATVIGPSKAVDDAWNMVQLGREVGSYVSGKLGSYFTRPGQAVTNVLSDSVGVSSQVSAVVSTDALASSQVLQFRNAFLANPRADELVVAMRQGGSLMTKTVKDSVVNSINGTVLGRFSPFIGSFVDKLGDALMDTVITKDSVASVIANAQSTLVETAVARGIPSADILGEIIPDTAVAIGQYARNPAVGTDIIAETISERLLKWATSDTTTAKYALSKLYSGAGAAKDTIIRIGTNVIGKAIAGVDVKGVASKFVDAVVQSVSTGGSVGTIAAGAHDLATQDFQAKMGSFMAMADSLKELVGEEAINYAQDAIIDAIAKKITDNAQKLFDNDLNGFSNAFTNATGYSLDTVINEFANGSKSLLKSGDANKDGKAVAMKALMKVVDKALPESVRRYGITDLLSKALSEDTLSGSSEEILDKVKANVLQEAYNVAKTKTKEYATQYAQDQFGSDVSKKIFEIVDSLDILYGDLPSDKVQNMQTSLLAEQFKFIMNELPKTRMSRFVSDVDETYFREAARYAYRRESPEHIGPFVLVYQSDTIKAFVDPQTKRVMLGIRGTADKRDVKAWVPTGLGLLKSTDRYAYDNEQLKSIFARYNPQEYTYYIAGHSLGGALSTQFKRDYPFIKNAAVYNSATSPRDLIDRSDSSVLRSYTANDIVYNILGGSLNATTVTGTKKKADTGIASLDTVLNLYGMLEGHKMNAFFVDERRDASYSY